MPASVVAFERLVFETGSLSVVLGYHQRLDLRINVTVPLST